MFKCMQQQQQQQQQQVEVLASCRHEWAGSSICVSSPHRNRSPSTKANPNNSIYLSIYLGYDVCMYVWMYVYWPRSGREGDLPCCRTVGLDLEMLLTLAGPPPPAARPRRRTRTTLSIYLGGDDVCWPRSKGRSSLLSISLHIEMMLQCIGFRSLPIEGVHFTQL